MVKVRSLKSALIYIKSLDSGTAISENAIRKLVVSGTVPSIRVGKKYLVNVDYLVNYFEGRLSPEVEQEKTETPEIGGDIRPVPECIKRTKHYR